MALESIYYKNYVYNPNWLVFVIYVDKGVNGSPLGDASVKFVKKSFYDPICLTEKMYIAK